MSSPFATIANDAAAGSMLGRERMSDDAFTQRRWDERWAAEALPYDPAEDEQLRDSLGLIRRFWPDPNGKFLEAGCGPAANALNLARAGAEVTGIDFSPHAIEAAEEGFRRHGVRGDFVLCDVRDIRFPDGTFDFVYAGGVVEHFRDTDRAIAEMARVLKPGGRVLLTVPALTLSYPYMFLRGNVPAIPVGEQAATFLHFRLLRGAFAEFGFERSFRKRRLAGLVADAGLVDVEVGRFDTYLPLLKIPGSLRGGARRLAQRDAFAPMWYATGRRPC
jgi:SAM-dependent methyltransferase